MLPAKNASYPTVHDLVKFDLIFFLMKVKQSLTQACSLQKDATSE